MAVPKAFVWIKFFSSCIIVCDDAEDWDKISNNITEKSQSPFRFVFYPLLSLETCTNKFNFTFFSNEENDF